MKESTGCCERPPLAVEAAQRQRFPFFGAETFPEHALSSILSPHANWENMRMVWRLTG
jgi:hypothetical protein